MLCEKWNVQPLSLLDGSLLGSMATAQLPAPLCDMAEDAAPRFQQFLYDEHRIEIPVIRWQERWHIRVSCQVYNGPEDYLRLAGAIDGSISSAF
jgi:isopenicillin-N epimerase